MLDAVADVASLAGYSSMSVEDIIGTAGVSRRTFYDTFAGKEDAFLAALDDVVEQLQNAVQTAFDANDTFAGGVRDCLAAFLQFVTDEPHYADMLLIEALAAGPAAIERRNATLTRFAHMLHDGAERLIDGQCPPALTAETVVGGIYEVVYSRLIAGEAKQLPDLLPDLTYSLLQPYIGDREARREARVPPSPPVDRGAPR
jgi:AcrR family transcriptional regulator